MIALARIAVLRPNAGRFAAGIASALTLSAALLHAAVCGAQSAPVTLQVQVEQDLRDYWLKAEKDFSQRAAATGSLTEKDVALEIAARAADRAKSYDAQIQAAIAALNAPKPTAPLTLPALPKITPLVLPHVEPPLPTPPVMPSLGASAVDTVFSRARQCEQDAKLDDSSDPGDLDHHLAEKLRRRQVFLQCHVPEMREIADSYEKQAMEKYNAAAAETRPDNKASLTGEADILRQIAAILRRGADTLSSGAPAVPPALFTPPLAEPAVGSPPGSALCKSSPSPSADGLNDPYLICDCAREYLGSTIAARYRSMLPRVLAYLSSDAYMDDIGMFRETGRYAPADLAIDIARKIPMLETAVTQVCHANLVGLEQAKLLAAQPHSPASGEEQVIASSAKWVRDGVYRSIETMVADLWLDYFKEIELGMGAVRPPDVLSLRWYQKYKFKDALRSLYDKWHPIFKAEEPTGTVDITGWAQEYVATCAANNAALAQWIDTTANTMKVILAPIHAARGALINDLKRWQVLAAADGWPDQQSLVPLGTAADQMWRTRYIGEYSKNDYGHEPKTVEQTVIGPPRLDPFEDPSPMSINKAPEGYDEFFGKHDDCRTWKVTAPAGIYMTYPLHSSSPLTDNVDLAGVDGDELAILRQPQRGGPAERASFLYGGVIYLVLDLFRQTEEVADFFFSGADTGQTP